MATKKTEFQITVVYKAISVFMVKAESEEEAKKIVLEKVKEIGIYEGEIQDETYAADGILNLDRTWNAMHQLTTMN